MATAFELRDFLTSIKALKDREDKMLRSFENVFGEYIETEFMEVTWGYLDLAVRQAELAFEDDDNNISWFIFDNDCGNEALEINDIPMDSIDTFVIWFFGGNE